MRDLVARLNAGGAGAIGFIYHSGHGAAEKDTNTPRMAVRFASLIAGRISKPCRLRACPTTRIALLIGNQSYDPSGNEFSRERMTKHASGWTKEFRQALQKKLRDAGFYAGRINGEFRESTISRDKRLLQSRSLRLSNTDFGWSVRASKASRCRACRRAHRV